jgi:hypothetical protein
VTSDTQCPRASDIENELLALLPTAKTQPGTVRVVTHPNELIIQLHPAREPRDEERTLAISGSCEDRARAVAVIIATWWPLEPIPPKIPLLGPKSLVSSQVTNRGTRHFSLAIGGFASVVKEGMAPGLRIEMVWAPWVRPFSLTASLTGSRAHATPLGVGKVQFQRYTSDVGVAWSHGFLRLDAAGIISLLSVTGQGYTTNRNVSGASMGMTLGVRLKWTWGRVLPWIEVRGIGWPQSQQIYVAETTTSTRTTHPLPHGELQLGLGISFPVF